MNMISFVYKKSPWLAVCWTAIIFILCCTPGRFIPTTNWLELLSFDKFVHASIFFGMSVLWLITLLKYNKITTLNTIIVLAGCIAYGGSLEIMQATVFSQRSGDWLDFIANSFGCLMGFWVFSKKKSIFSNF